MADGQGGFGGGGSVHWRIDVSDGEAPEIKSKVGPRSYVVSGVDKHAKKDKEPDYFFINIQPPPGGTVRVVPHGRGIRVFVEVDQKQPEQMLVQWAYKESEVPADAVDIAGLLKRGASAV
jgi:hypothetical protein